MAHRKLAKRACRLGITRMSVVVIIFLILALLVVLVPAIAKAREAARRTSCTNRLKEIGLAVHTFEGVHSAIVPGTLASSQNDPKSLTVEDGVTWCALLLPFLEQEMVWKKFSAENALEWQGYFPEGKSQQRDTANLDAACANVFLCPSRRAGLQRCKQGDSTDGDGGACGDYVAVACFPSDNSRWFDVTAPITESCGVLVGAERFDPSSDASPKLASWRSRLTFANITDGLSNTFLVGEKHLTSRGLGNVAEGDGCMYFYHSQNPRPIDGGKRQAEAASYAFRAIKWEMGGGTNTSLAKQGPHDAPNNSQFGSWHAGVSLFVLADGAVKQIRLNGDRTILSYMAHRSDANAINVGCDHH